MSASHCPCCHACVRPNVAWCSLCHVDLRPQPEPVPPVAVAVERHALAVTRDNPAPGRHARAEGWPCLPCGTENDLESSTCVTCGASFLGGLQPDAPVSLRLPLIGDITRFGRAALCCIAVGVALVAALMISGLLGLAGQLL